ncbi:hypothetical protein Pmar_PMAR003216 [Perkinsus marinus ATCC 50983]|uniref:Uncharacterized protein n=1 Tax=Perkinsus marinus (strain ATCC 50983 / TXsc) TaxID=423536 RepID=C5LKH6_PERM5|nr:hypothetical protein Pmar_PMAR003216 [Perkinsus marinus ATCC 50983]EER02743.1 hypothetical protein Pmar_PMAR003216 [Perkinsus marinus ATCC 50983]|eukprot:XP_002770927.1 hypothetical protein Pmar_PMAR003216 [Perkinsus marinus ATCC 50983]
MRRPKDAASQSGSEEATPGQGAEDFAWMQNYEAPTTPPCPSYVNYSIRRDSAGDDASTLSSVTRLGDFARDEILALADLAGEIRSRGLTGVMKVAASEAKEIVSSQAGPKLPADFRAHREEEEPGSRGGWDRCWR